MSQVRCPGAAGTGGAFEVSVATLYGTLSPNYLSARTRVITASRPLDLHRWAVGAPAKPDGHGDPGHLAWR